MICPRCGHEIKEGNAFCKQCGYHVTTNKTKAASTANINEIMAKLNSNRYLKYVVVIVAVVAAVLVLRGIIGGSGEGFSSYENTIKAFVDAMENQDEDAYLKCYPKKLRENMKKDISRQLSLERSHTVSGDDEFSPYRFLAYEEDLDYNVVAGNDMTQEELDEINENYGLKAKEGRYANVKIMLIYKYDDGTATYSHHVDIPVGKIGNRWYVLAPQTTKWP